MMDLRRLRYFVTLAETLHFSRAALRLNIAQPPLSHQIRVLEDELGARLFERSNRHVELTPAGQALLPEARALLAQAERTSAIAARVQRGELGELRLGFTSAAALTPAIPRLILAYRQLWPGVHLRIAELTTQEQLSAMLERRLDCAFVRGTQAPDLPAHLAAIRLVDDALIAVFPPQHRLANSRAAISVSALAGESFVMYPRESGVAVYEQIIGLCLRAGFSPQVVQEAHAVATIMGLVAAGLGIAIVPASFSHIGVHGVIHRPLREQEAKSAMWLVHRNGDVSLQEQHFRALAQAQALAPNRQHQAPAT